MIGGHRPNNYHFGKHEVVVITEMCGYRPNNFGKRGGGGYYGDIRTSP